MSEYKSKIIKGLKIEVKGTTYDKIIYMNCSSDGLYFDCLQNENIRLNINCKLNEAKISIEND